MLVAVVFVCRSVEFVGAAFAYSDEDGAASLTVFGGHAVLLDAKLLDGVQRWRNRCATEYRCGNGAAVQHAVVVARAAAADAQIAVVAAAIAASLLGHACGKRKQTVNVTSR